jgi:hypothetical protein
MIRGEARKVARAIAAVAGRSASSPQGDTVLRQRRLQLVRRPCNRLGRGCAIRRVEDQRNAADLARRRGHGRRGRSGHAERARGQAEKVASGNGRYRHSSSW